MNDNRVRPFLKWAGSKYRILNKLAPHLVGKRLIEPFVGSGAVFLNLSFDKYLLGDINPDLVNVFEYVKKDKHQFIREVENLFTIENNYKENYLKLREEFNSGITGKRRAAVFMYLNRHCFNGLCRYNQSGGFNVPFGRYKSPSIPNDSVQRFIDIAESTEFVCDDFQAVMGRAKIGDVVYCDPPYVPLSDTAFFTTYAAGGFTHQDQMKLAEKAKQLANKGIRVVISNHDTDVTRELYSGAKIESFLVQRMISRDVANRKQAKELLAIFNG